MRSKAHLMQGHPLHPMLIPFPIAFMIGALLSDIVSMASGSAAWYFVGYVLTIGGFVTALLAALPGLVDYVSVIRPRTQAKRTATIHMSLNVLIAGLYIVSWLVKNSLGYSNWGSLILEIIGCLGLVASGWLGWHLVYRHHIGVTDAVPGSEPVTPIQRRAG